MKHHACPALKVKSMISAGEVIALILGNARWDATGKLSDKGSGYRRILIKIAMKS